MKLIFAWSQMLVTDELKRRKRAVGLMFFDFIEALARLADFISPPSMEHLLAPSSSNVCSGAASASHLGSALDGRGDTSNIMDRAAGSSAVKGGAMGQQGAAGHPLEDYMKLKGLFHVAERALLAWLYCIGLRACLVTSRLVAVTLWEAGFVI